MKDFSAKTFVLYLLVIIYILVSILFQINNTFSYYTTIINPVAWLLLFLFTIYVTFSEKKRLKAKTEKTQTVLIIIMIYLIVYFFLGMFFGYAKSPYSHKIIQIIKNAWSFVAIIFFQEYVREALLPNRKVKWLNYILITILFSTLEINFYKFGSNFIDFETTFKYSSSVLLPVLARNILFTYLAINGGFGCNICYRAPLAFANIIMPIFPKMEWFWTAAFELILVVVVYIKINYIHEKKNSRESRRNIRKQKLTKQIPFFAILIIFICFVTGVFKYQPVAVMSNSMADLIKRGDIVIVQKTNKEEILNLKVNDVIQYQLDGSTVIHRIIEIEKNDEQRIFTTKGDNNELPDLKKVYNEQVLGKVLIKIPKIGYPAVLFNELIQRSKPDVET